MIWYFENDHLANIFEDRCMPLNFFSWLQFQTVDKRAWAQGPELTRLWQQCGHITKIYSFLVSDTVFLLTKAAYVFIFFVISVNQSLVDHELHWEPSPRAKSCAAIPAITLCHFMSMYVKFLKLMRFFNFCRRCLDSHLQYLLFFLPRSIQRWMVPASTERAHSG